MTFILASQSPRRRQLLSSIGLVFDVMPSDIPEIHQPGEAPQDYVSRLSREKAATIARTHPEAWIIAADTTVVLGNELLEKPADAEDAKRMLGAISGTTHVVYTGVTLQHFASGWSDTQVAETNLRMLPLRKQDIDWYVSSGEPLDKAGAYAAQGIGAIFIESIDGSYTNVVGLPLALLFQMLRRAGVDLTTIEGT
jgi:septum formation protein